MPLTPIELEERWKTPDGRKRLERVVASLRSGEKEWAHHLIGFVGLDEVLKKYDLRDLRGSPMQHVVIPGAFLQLTDLQGADLFDAYLEGAELASANLKGANLVDADLKGANLEDANLEGANLSLADLQGANLISAKLTNTTLFLADLTGADLGSVRYSHEHDSLSDHSETVFISGQDKYLNWGSLRNLFRFPLFGVSWAAFVTSVGVVNLIGMLNHTRLMEGLKYPIPIPHRMKWVLLDSFLLVVATTVYKLACPTRVQEFTISQWVEEHRQPRLWYLWDSWSRKLAQIVTLVFSVLGGGLAAFLIGERLYLAAKYLFEDLAR